MLSYPHSNPVAAIPNLKAIVSDAIAALAKKALARRHEAAVREKVLADEANERRRATAWDKALANEANKQRCHEAAAWEKALADKANKRCRHKATAREKALAEDKRRQEETASIRRIRVQCALLAAPLDAILAEIERDNIAHEANE